MEEISLRPGSSVGGWYVVGLLRNSSDQAWGRPWVCLSLVGGGRTLAEVTLPLAWAHLGPGEVVPFEVAFEGEGTGEGVNVTLDSFDPQAFQRLILTTSGIQIARDALRRQYVLGWLANESGKTAEVEAAVVVARDADGTILDVAPAAERAFRLEAGDRRPFVARIEARQLAASAELYLDSVEAGSEESDLFVEIEDPRMLIGSQGQAYWIGSLRNRSPLPLWVSGVAGWLVNGHLVGAVAIDIPAPIMPGERLAVAFSDVPGIEGWLRDGSGDPTELEAKLWLDPEPLPGGTEIAHLGLSVRSLEMIGSTLFLRGGVQNSGARSVQKASVLAAVRDTSGSLLSAGGSEVAAELGPGQTAEFVLVLPLPAGVRLAGLEYDLRALGVR